MIFCGHNYVIYVSSVVLQHIKVIMDFINTNDPLKMQKMEILGPRTLFFAVFDDFLGFFWSKNCYNLTSDQYFLII